MSYYFFLARSCRNPGTPAHGVTYSTEHTYGKTVTYICEKGYKLVGSQRRTCQESTKLWTGSLPSCQCKSYI